MGLRLALNSPSNVENPAGCPCLALNVAGMSLERAIPPVVYLGCWTYADCRRLKLRCDRQVRIHIISFRDVLIRCMAGSV